MTTAQTPRSSRPGCRTSATPWGALSLLPVHMPETLACGRKAAWATPANALAPGQLELLRVPAGEAGELCGKERRQRPAERGASRRADLARARAASQRSQHSTVPPRPELRLCDKRPQRGAQRGAVRDPDPYALQALQELQALLCSLSSVQVLTLQLLCMQGVSSLVGHRRRSAGRRAGRSQGGGNIVSLFQGLQ